MRLTNTASTAIRARKGKAAPNPLLSFPNGALVHFAVSNMEVRMTTRLEGAGTSFLPFNRGDNGAAGNPAYTPLTPMPSPIGEGEGVQCGHRTAYLWEDIWARDSWLEILGRYLVAQKNEKKQIKKIIFPRFHQLDATRKLLAAVLEEGAGRQISDSTFGGFRQNQFDCMVGTFPGRFAQCHP